MTVRVRGRERVIVCQRAKEVERVYLCTTSESVCACVRACVCVCAAG